MGGVSLEMRYRDDVSIKQPFCMVAWQGVFTRTRVLQRGLVHRHVTHLSDRPRWGREALWPQGSFSGALP